MSTQQLKPTAGPIIRWLDYGADGWKPESFLTVEEALLTSNLRPFIITRIVKFAVVEKRDEQSQR